MKTSSRGTTNIVPLLSFTDGDGKLKSLPFIATTKKATDPNIVCKFKQNSKCIYSEKNLKKYIGN